MALVLRFVAKTSSLEGAYVVVCIDNTKQHHYSHKKLHNCMFFNRPLPCCYWANRMHQTFRMWGELQRWAWTGTHSVSYLQVGTLPEARQRLSILAGGSEGKADVLRVIPHWQLHFRPNVLRENTPGRTQRSLVQVSFLKQMTSLHSKINPPRLLCSSEQIISSSYHCANKHFPVPWN